MLEYIIMLVILFSGDTGRNPYNENVFDIAQQTYCMQEELLHYVRQDKSDYTVWHDCGIYEDSLIISIAWHSYNFHKGINVDWLDGKLRILYG